MDYNDSFDIAYYCTREVFSCNLNPKEYESMHDCLCEALHTSQHSLDALWLFDLCDREQMQKNEFLSKYSSLPLYSYGNYYNHKLRIISTEVEKAFAVINAVLLESDDDMLGKLRESLFIQIMNIQPNILKLMTPGDSSELRKVTLDPLGLYYYGELLSGDDDTIPPKHCVTYANPEFNEKSRIVIDDRKIRCLSGKEYPKLLAVVVLHELMHALMDPHNYGEAIKYPRNRLYYIQKEEAMANALVLHFLNKSESGKHLLDYAEQFMLSQSLECGYKYGVELYKSGEIKSNDWLAEKISGIIDIRNEQDFIQKVMNE